VSADGLEPDVMDARTQRWRERRESYRRRGEAFDPSTYGVELVDKLPARDFVVRHHYSGSFPSTSVRVGLFRARTFFAPELVGVCTFGTGASQASIPRWTGLPSELGLQLNRLVLLDEVPFNAETWTLARAFALLRALRPHVRVVLSYSDPVPRRDEAGRMTMPGHVGAAYQAKGARYVGRSDPETKWLDARGCLLDARSLSKVRALDGGEPSTSKGGASFARTLVALGAPLRRPHETWTGWVRRITWGGEGPFTAMQHPGNHVYVFDAAGVAVGLPGSTLPARAYPKKDAA
jgi:hypothetical protein